jgi:hypothetical protein
VKRDVWNRMVLQSEPHLKNGIVARCRQVSNRRDEFSKWHSVCERIHGCLMHRGEAVGKWAVCIDMASKWDNTGEVTHCISHVLPGSVRHGRAHQDIFLARPAGNRDLKCG